MAFWEFRGERYPYVPLMAMTPRDVMTLQTQLVGAEYTSLRTADEVMGRISEIQELPEDQIDSAPEVHFCTLVQLWAAMRAAGERLAITDLVDSPESDFMGLEFVPDTGDPDESDDAGKAKAPNVGRSTSGQGKHRGGKRKKGR